MLPSTTTEQYENSPAKAMEHRREAQAVANKSTPSNRSRKRRAQAALLGYWDKDHDHKSNVIDLLSDLMHYCSQTSRPAIDFEDCLRTARSHFHCETVGGEP